MTTHSRFVALVVLLCAAVSSVVNAQHADHAAMLKQRGAAAMGFDQDKAVHHFLVMPDGGTIQVEARDTADTATLAAIRTHLRQIAISFSAGNFDAPFATHGEVPPGVPATRQLKSAIKYRFEETANGGRVRIATTNADAVAAIHAFLRYQIREHRTGD